IILAALNLLTPQKANLLLLSPDNEGRCELKEKWFGTQYSVEEIDKEWSKRWSADFELNPDLHLPTENMFIDGAQQTRLYWTTMLQTGLMPSQPPHPLNNEEAGKP
uniref:Peptidase M16 middle/third domain-containing protein n=1 Tax=Lepisosteus oculatus TaxID=7918 RepID=W5LWR7_LEPOC